MTAPNRSAGLVTAEFSLVLLVFLTFACALMELARAMYVITTIPVVAQRAALAAANADFSSPAALQAVRRQAVFRDSAGTMLLGAPITDAHVRISYLALTPLEAPVMTPAAPATLLSCPVNNRNACLQHPYDAACIRLVQVQICDPAVTNSCVPAVYRSLFTAIPLPFRLPIATTVAPAETLGAVPGAAPCP